MVADKSNQADQQESRHPGIDTKRDMAGFFAGDPGGLSASDFHRDVGPRIPYPYNEGSPFTKLGSISIIMRMPLDNA